MKHDLLLQRLTGRVRALLPRTLQPVVLMYHRIADAPRDPWNLAIPPALFEAQLAALSRRRRVLPLAEFIARRQDGALPPGAAAITFDDGYACNSRVAAPLLQRRGLPATVFVTSGAVGSEAEFWWDALERIVFEGGARRLSIQLERESLEVDLEQDRGQGYLTLWAALKGCGGPQREEALAKLHEQSGAPRSARASHRIMDRAEVRELSGSGLIEIGAHGVSHASLAGLDEAEQRREVEGSRHECAALTGCEPRAFAYPFGDYTGVTVEVVRRAGFTVACTTAGGAVGPGARPLETPRIQAPAVGGEAFIRSLRC